VAGLALLNPWVRSYAGLARAQVKHYYRQRLLEPAFWRKLLTGGVGWRALHSFSQSVNAMRNYPTQPAKTASFRERMAQAWRAFPGPVLLLLSERDLTAQEFQEALRDKDAWKRQPKAESTTQTTLLGADHTCSQPPATVQTESAVLNWLQRLA
jgi:hypothetical protein